jgi:hypothetical protein
VVYTEKSLFTILCELKSDYFEIPDNIEPFQLIKEVCRHLGNPDPVLRDELGYTLLADWIYKRKIKQTTTTRTLL